MQRRNRGPVFSSTLRFPAVPVVPVVPIGHLPSWGHLDRSADHTADRTADRAADRNFDHSADSAIYKPTVVTDPVLNPDPVVARCQQGDKAAFAELFRRHQADVGRIVQRLLGPVPDVEDVIQEIFIQVFHSIPKFKGKAKFSTWLHSLSVNVVLMHRRAQRSRPILTAESTTPVASDSAKPDELAISRERVRAFYAVLDRLPDAKRTVFILHEIEGIQLKEIAKILGIPALTVRTRLFYTRREIVKLLLNEPSLAPLAAIMQRTSGGDRYSSDAQDMSDESDNMESSLEVEP